MQAHHVVDGRQQVCPSRQLAHVLGCEQVLLGRQLAWEHVSQGLHGPLLVKGSATSKEDPDTGANAQGLQRRGWAQRYHDPLQ